MPPLQQANDTAKSSLGAKLGFQEQKEARTGQEKTHGEKKHAADPQKDAGEQRKDRLEKASKTANCRKGGERQFE